MKKQPHIIIFNPDQWRSDVMGCNGNNAAVTPNVDRMVREDGVSFKSAFCQNTVCTPSRCSFMTGWYPHVRGHRTMVHMLHPERDEPNLLRVLKDNGYFVWWGGKNDLTPGQNSVEPYCDIRFEATDEDRKRWGVSQREGNHGGTLDWRGNREGANYYSFYKGLLDKGDEPFYADADWEKVCGAIDFIHGYEGEKPLCIYLPLTYPHPPYCVEEPWFSITETDKLPARPILPEGLPGKPSILQGIYERQNLSSWTEERWDKLRACYYGMCSRVDHQFGMVNEALRDMGLYDDSAIFLFSDHGDYTGDYGIVEKTQNTFEDALSRVPLVVKPPKGVPVLPRVTGALTELIDFTATVYDLTGIDPGYDHFGKSLLPVLAGETDELRDAVFCEGGRLKGEVQAMERVSLETTPDSLYMPRISLQVTDASPYHTKATMCRTNRYKYIKRYYEEDELYDLETDPTECVNRSNDPALAQVLASLKERMLTWYMGTCDVVPRVCDQR